MPWIRPDAEGVEHELGQGIQRDKPLSSLTFALLRGEQFKEVL